MGILNFFNAILTSIMARKREFAMLQSIGMTGKQLKSMLVYEGLIITIFVITISLILSFLAGPLLNHVFGRISWFFSYHFTILPIIIVAPFFFLFGILLPLISYKKFAKQTIVERLRQAE